MPSSVSGTYTHSILNLALLYLTAPSPLLNLIYLFLAVLGLPCCAWAFPGVEWGLLSSCSAGFSLQWLLLLQSTGSRAQARLWHMGLAAPWHVQSSRTSDQACVPCIGRRVLSHWAIREVLIAPLLSDTYPSKHAL